MGYKKPFIPPKVTATWNICNHTLIFSTLHFVSIVLYHNTCSQSMWPKGCPPKTAIIAPPGGRYGLQQYHDNKSESLDNGSWSATGQDSWSGKYTNQYHPQHRYGHPHSQQPFPGAAPCYKHSPFNVTQNSSQPTTSICQRFPSNGPLWQVYDLYQGGYGKSQIFPQQQFPGQGPQSPCALSEPPGPPGSNPVNWQIFWGSTPPPGPHSGAAAIPLICLPSKRSLPPTELRKTVSQGLWICAHWRILPTMIMMQMITATIRRNWVVPRVTPQSVCSKLNLPWSSSPKVCGRPTIVHSTSGRKYWWMRV